MRRIIALLLALALPALGGCARSIYANYRDIESLEVVQALGIDSGPGGVTVSVATGADASGREPLRLSAEGASLDEAMRALSESAGAASLFFSGTGAVVLGEGAAAETARWLDAMARSRELRLDTELYVLRGARAAELVAGKSAPEDVFAALDALAERMRRSGAGRVPTCADAARALTGSGAALAAAIELEGGEPVPAGYAALVPGGPAIFLTGAAARGTGIFLGGPGAELTALPGGVVCELAGVETELNPVWARDGSLARLEVSAAARAMVTEAPVGLDLGSAETAAALEGELAEAVRGWLEAALAACAGSGADFLGLGRVVETRDPARFAALGSWDEALSGLRFDVSCAAEIVNIREYALSPFGEAAA